MGTEFQGLRTKDMIVDTLICVFCFLILERVGILNLWIAQPTKYMKLNVHRINIISGYLFSELYLYFIMCFCMFI